MPNAGPTAFAGLLRGLQAEICSDHPVGALDGGVSVRKGIHLNNLRGRCLPFAAPRDEAAVILDITVASAAIGEPLDWPRMRATSRRSLKNRMFFHAIHRLDELLPWNWAAEMERRRVQA
jgi:hypothetical protein